MIEVEKKFQPTEEQLQKLLEGASFIEDKKIVDVYYDTPNFDLFKSSNHTKLRCRDGLWELKIQIKPGSTEGAKQAIEITDKKEILEKLGLDLNTDFDEHIKQNFTELVRYVTHRVKYHKGDFVIDIDEIDTGLKACEIELLVNSESEIEDAEKKIIAFANQSGLKMAKPPTKIGETLRVNRPEVYKELFENK